MKLTKGCQIQILLGIATIIYANITTVQNIIRYTEFRDEKKKNFNPLFLSSDNLVQ